MTDAREHTAPNGAGDAFVEAIARRVAELVRADEAQQPPAVPSLDGIDLGIELMRAYDVKQAAHYLGTSESSVYKIPEDELPRVRRCGSGIGFLGISLLCYMHRLPPVDVAGLVQRMRERLAEEAEAARPAVRPIRPGRPGKTRIL